MGASQSSFRPAEQVLPGSYLGELGSDIQYEKSMGSSRFLKAIRARHRHGALVVKVFVKPDAHMDLRPLSKRIAAEKNALADCPNLLPYTQALATERAGYLIRQWVASSLYDRISTRPFLTLIEKKWIAFQLLTALKDLHSRKISHGDIKSENVLVTSWNWVYLSDFASTFKPTYLPEDDPSDFSYFFDTSGRRTCYVAPERFYTADSEISRKKASLEPGRSLGKVTEAMDVFSLGCVLAELLVEGAPPFTLSQLFKYRSGEYSLEGYLAQIEDQAMRGLVKSMTSLQPSARLSCQQYLDDARGTVFQTAFYDFFHDFIASTNDLVSASASGSDLGQFDQQDGLLSGTSTPVPGRTSQAGQDEGAQDKQDRTLTSNADDVLNAVWVDFERVKHHMTGSTVGGTRRDLHAPLSSTEAVYPVQLHLAHIETEPQDTLKAPDEDGLAILILALICANIRNCSRPATVVRALDMLLYIGRYLTDETRLDWLLPYVVAGLSNDAPIVRVAALRTLTEMLRLTQTITPANATVFTEYILPNVTPLGSDSDEAVRCAYAQSLATLAESGQRFLDMTQAMKADGTFKLTRTQDLDSHPYEMTYDASLHDLQSQIQEQINTLLIDPTASVKRALMSNIVPLCVFLGRSRTAEVFSLMTTLLNDRDWLLRSAFFESTVGVSTCIGSKSVDEYILPLMTEALADNEESVIARELNSLSILAELGLYQRGRLWDTLSIVLTLLAHPNTWIRTGAARFVAASVKLLPTTDIWCNLYPALRKMLSADISEITDLSILQSSVTPIPRPVYEAAATWAARSAKSPFWQKRKPASERLSLEQVLFDSTKLPLLSEEDKQEMQRLHTLGMTEDDSFKLLAMRGYIFSVAIARRSAKFALQNQEEADPGHLLEDSEASLVSLGVNPQTIIFSTGEGTYTADNLNQLRDWPRRASLRDMPRSSSSVDLLRQGSNRSASGSSTVDALRRRLAAGKGSASSLASGPPSRRTSMNITRPPFPPSPSSIATRTDTDEASSEASFSERAALEDSVRSVSTVKPPSSITGASTSTRTRSKVNSNGVELSKAQAAVGSDMTTALGHLTLEHQADRTSVSGMSETAGHVTFPPSAAEQRFTTTYEGNDSSIKLLLDRVYLDNYREPMPEFGPFVASKVPRKRSIRTVGRERLHNRPQGNLVGHLAEHTAGITCIAVSPDHLFFITGSEDGTARVWDSIRLEKNVVSRSRQVINQGGRITCVTMLEHSHCFASASTNGSLWISRVDVQVQSGGLPKYGKQAVIRQHVVNDTEQDFITCMLHYDTDASSKLVYATSQSEIAILDVRTLRILDRWQNPQHLGPISSVCIDRKHAWLVVGTLSGNLCLWDLRFGLLLKTWKAGSAEKPAGAIVSCQVHKTRGKGKCIVVTQEGSEGFETWDIETGQRVEAFQAVKLAKGADDGQTRRRTSSVNTTVTVRTLKANATYAKDLDTNPAKAIEALLRQHEQASSLVSPPGEEEQEATAVLHTHKDRSTGPAIRAVLIGSDYANTQDSAALPPALPALAEAQASESASPAGDATWAVTAGEDRKIRFLDLGSIEKSCLVSCGGEGEERPVYSANKNSLSITYTEETTLPRTASSGPNKRQALIATHQQTLLKAHQDAITALALLELPFRCIVSGDRSGIIKVWE